MLTVTLVNNLSRYWRLGKGLAVITDPFATDMFFYREHAGRVVQLLRDILTNAFQLATTTAGVGVGLVVDEVTALLTAGGFKIRLLDSDENDCAQMRHMVNGISFDANERTFQVRLPERSDALLEFLESTPDDVDVTLAQYRNDGQMAGSVLIVLQGDAVVLHQFGIRINVP
jgi:hypothetical protein